MSIHFAWSAVIDIRDPRSDPDAEMHESPAEQQYAIDRYVGLTEQFYVHCLGCDSSSIGFCKVTLRTNDKDKLFLFLCDYHNINPNSQKAARVLEDIFPNGVRQVPFSLKIETERVHKDLYDKYKLKPGAIDVG